MSFTLRVDSYRGLRKVAWSPSGVCAVVGPNASGKTTLLDVPQLLGDALDRGISRALEEHGGLDTVHTLAAPEQEPTGFEVEHGGLRWRLELPSARRSFRPLEQVYDHGSLVVDRRTGEDDALIEGKPVSARDRLATAIAFETVPALEPLDRLLQRYRFHGQYELSELRRRGSDESTQRRLSRRGGNVFSVLRNWRDRRDDEQQRYAFVIDGLRRLFPSFFEDLEFSKAAQIVGAEMRLRPYDQLIPASLAPDGWFVALLHLTALASTDRGDAVAIDEPENALHPHAIKILLELTRDWSQRRGVTVLLATHSPVIIDGFRECPDQLYVMEPAQASLPVALTQLHDPSWLAHFALGDLYTHDEFGAPSSAAPSGFSDDDGRADHNRPL